jgi:hypothetical protein
LGALCRIAYLHHHSVLAPQDGDEKTALDSIFAIFPIVCEILRRHGSGCGEISMLDIPVLNPRIRPFTEKWHELTFVDVYYEPKRCTEFLCRIVSASATSARLHSQPCSDNVRRESGGARENLMEEPFAPMNKS